MSDYRELLIGCGSRRDKNLFLSHREFQNVTTIDINPDHKPDIIYDLCQLPLPLEDNSFDEIHAYEVLEHTGAQGDYRFFFAQFSDFWRILKPDGVLFATVPMHNSPWAWGDPSHTRIIQKESLIFLNQPTYTEEVGKTSISDFRYIYHADFDVLHIKEGDGILCFVIKAVKPSRITYGRD